MKQILKRWTGIGLMVVSVLTMGGTFMVQSATDLAVSASPQQVLIADGGGDRPAPCPKGKCWSGDATA
jgi:hypothetical protein